MNTRLALLTATILCVSADWLNSQPVSAGNDSHIEQVGNKSESAKWQLQAVAGQYAVETYIPEKPNGHIITQQGNQAGTLYNYNFQKALAMLRYNERADDSKKVTIEDKLREFKSKSGDEQVEAFRKIFEAVMKEKQAGEAGNENNKSPEFDFDMMALDETRTNTGREFFDQFYAKLQQPAGTGNITLQVTEKIHPGAGTIIYVNINQIEVFNARLTPGLGQIERAVNNAIHQVQKALESKSANFITY